MTVKEQLRIGVAPSQKIASVKKRRVSTPAKKNTTAAICMTKLWTNKNIKLFSGESLRNIPEAKFKTNLVYILHNADFLASKIEYDNWKNEGGSTVNKAEKTKASTGKTVNASEGLMNLVKNI